MNCLQAKRLLERYADRELDDVKVDSIKAHLAQCPACQKEYAALLAVRHTLNTHPRISASPDFDMRVLDAVMAQRERPHSLLYHLATTWTRPCGELLDAAMAGVAFSLVIIGIVLLPQLLSLHRSGGSLPLDSSSHKIATGHAPYDRDGFYAWNGLPYHTFEPSQSRGLDMLDSIRPRHDIGKRKS